MKDTLSVSLVQTKLHWENHAANRNMFSKKMETIKDTDVIILPEMFTTGFSMRPEQLAETMDGTTVQWMKTEASKHQTVICGSLIIKENDNFFNRFLWVEPNGRIIHYDKRHLFSMANEDQYYSAGQDKILIDYLGWKICPLICYDLRFPVWSRNIEDYDIAIYVANWPEKRSYHWKNLLIARAIENQCYVLGVNRVGKDEKGLYYSGDSSIVAPDGALIWQETVEEAIFTYRLEKEHLHTIRKNLPFLADRD